MTNQEVIDRALASIKPETSRFIELSWDVAEILENYMLANNLKNKDLAEKMEVSPSVVSDWLTGMHNFTLRTLAKFEGRLGIDMVKELYKLHLKNLKDKLETQSSLNNNQAAEEEIVYKPKRKTKAIG